MLKRTLSILTIFSLIASVSAEQLRFKTSLAHPSLVKGKTSQTYLKIGLTGFEFKNEADRPKTNIAIVIDKSGSMNWGKIENAKKAAIMAVNRLGADDIVSVLTYSDSVNVVIPATKISDKAEIAKKISSISSSGGTALFAGVSKGGAEVKKFLDEKRINRVILLSDGQANVGPSSPTLLGDLALSLAKDNIAVTTIGIGHGYNENVMVALANKGEGCHYFAEHSDDLVTAFNREFGDLMSVCAKQVDVKITLNSQVGCKKSVGRQAKIDGNVITYTFPQVYSGQEKFLILELDVASSDAIDEAKVADVEISYYNAQSKVDDKLTSTVNCRYVEDESEVNRLANREVVKDAVEQIAAVNMVEAIRLREAGDVDAAEELIGSNSGIISRNARKYNIEEQLRKLRDLNSMASDEQYSKKVQMYSQNAAINAKDFDEYSRPSSLEPKGTEVNPVKKGKNDQKVEPIKYDRCGLPTFDF